VTALSASPAQVVALAGQANVSLSVSGQQFVIDKGRVVASGAAPGLPVAVAIAGPTIWVAGQAIDPRTPAQDANSVTQYQLKPLRALVHVPVGTPVAVVAQKAGVWVMSGGPSGNHLVLYRVVDGALSSFYRSPDLAPPGGGSPLSACGDNLDFAGTSPDGNVVVQEVSLRGTLLRRWSLENPGDVFVACDGANVAVAVEAPGGPVFQLSPDGRVTGIAVGRGTVTGLVRTGGDLWLLTYEGTQTEVATLTGLMPGGREITHLSVRLASSATPLLAGSGNELVVGWGDEVLGVALSH
jgi:hypothetical protein